MISKYANTLDALFKYMFKRHDGNKHGINNFWDDNFFFEKKQRESLICLKNCKMNNFLAFLELCAFYIKFKVKFMTINFRGRTNGKTFMQT